MPRNIRRISATLAWLVLVAITSGMLSAAEARRVVSLDGIWQIAEGSLDEMPARFASRVMVPGLVDMAQPSFDSVGYESPLRQAFWYRRTFTVDGPIPAVAQLKIHKACFGTRVFLNGKLVGDHMPSFTPGRFDVRGLLKGSGQTNELVIRVGAWRSSAGKGLPDGFDFEKIRYIPGIFDSVELILSGTPHIVRVQAVPEVEAKTVRVVAVLRSAAGPTDAKVACRVREAVSGKLVGSAESQTVRLAQGTEKPVELRIPIADCRLWSPDDPFLYALETSTGADTLAVRFGMRSFRLDQKTGRAVLNGKPYFLRGTNVCVYRFFEDPARGDRPWRQQWVKRLHQVFRDMHWNSIRYCIGFPPEIWYDVADELGILIQDEFPIWYGGDRWPKELQGGELIKEYTEWMQERWNHPCVVIWDAQNETVSNEIGKAIREVRKLDLSNRPWDNGYMPPQEPGDVFEAHPYAFFHANSRLSMFAKLPGKPGVRGGLRGSVRDNESDNPVIINEYGWLWLNRDGTPTTLSKKFYDLTLGPQASPEARRQLYARLLAAKTEFWRCRRQVAGVLHFCGLGYSRAGGQTSDHFLDIEKLTLEPNFQRFVGDSFAPVGVMVDFWHDELPAGQSRTVPIGVVVINDLQRRWQGKVRFQLLRQKRVPAEQSQEASVDPLGERTLAFQVALPAEPGDYQLVAELTGAEGRPVRSLRDFAVLTEQQQAARRGIATGKPVQASSTITVGGERFPPEGAVDGKPNTRWSSEFSDPQWIAIDLGKPTRISRVELTWQGACGKAYAIQVSLDGKTWKDVYTTQSGSGGTDVIRFKPAEARFVRMHGTRRGTKYGYSLWEFRVFP